MNHLFEDKIAHMETGEMSPYSNSTRQGSTSSLDCSETSTLRRTASLPRNSASTIRTVVIGLKANEELRLEIFGHSRNHLGDLTNSSLVVIDCLSKLRDELGLDRKADDQMFAGVNERKLAAELKKQKTDLNLILNPLRKKLEQGGCRFDILTKPGRGSADILIQTAKALNPHLVLLELAFARDRKRIQRELQCNVALMKKDPLETPKIFEFTPKYPGPIDSLHDRDSKESDNPSESAVDPEALDSTPEMSPSRLPFHKDVPILSSFLFALKGFTFSSDKVKDKVKARNEIEDLQKKELSSHPDALMKERSGLLILKETLNLKTAEFITEINNGRDSGYFVSKAWMLSLDEHEEDQALTSVLRQTGYLEIYQTDTTVFYEKINEAVQVSNSCNENIDLGGGDTNKVVASSDNEHKIRDTEKRFRQFHLASQLKRRHKQEVTCSRDPQHLTVSCTPEPSPSSSSQGEYISKYSTRQAVGDFHVTIPRKREVQTVRTGADKRISMRTVYCCGLSDYHEDSISLKVSAYTSLTCCLKSDSDDKKVQIEFSTIGGEVKLEDNVNPKTNTVVLKSVRCNVDAYIIHSEGTDDFEPIGLYIQESDGQCLWRRVLKTYELFDDNGQPRRQDDLLWMELSGNHPKNSEPGSRTLELQCHVPNRIHYDLDRCCHDAHALQLAERDPVILEGDIFEDLKSNILLELNVRYQVVISYNEPRLPKPGQKFVATTRVDKPLDFDCVLEFRTRKLSSLGSRASY